MFVAGTAVVIGPVGLLNYKGQDYVPEKPKGELSLRLKKTLEDIQV
jgi:hypothetical protein